jgi:hypothetical protein
MSVNSTTITVAAALMIFVVIRNGISCDLLPDRCTSISDPAARV